MNRLREELDRILRECPAQRPPALRRSLSEDWLYAADLPRAAGEETVQTFLERVRAAGWRAELREGWIELDRRVTAPPAGWHPGDSGPETACCLSLLKRDRPARGNESPEEAEKAAARAERLLLKAGEAGGNTWEEACGRLHREWAVRLREGKEIPPVNPRFFEQKEEHEPC